MGDTFFLNTWTKYLGLIEEIVILTFRKGIYLLKCGIVVETRKRDMFLNSLTKL